jgi:hypothetical protein
MVGLRLGLEGEKVLLVGEKGCGVGFLHGGEMMAKADIFLLQLS